MKIEEKDSRFELQKIAIVRSHMVRPGAFYQQQGKLSLNIEIGHSFNEEAGRLTVFLGIQAHDNGQKEERLEIEVNSESIFSILTEPEEGDLNLEFFSKVNAPAIIYPYLRQHVTYLSLQSGAVNPIILPILNFVQLEKRQSEKKHLDQ